MNILELKTVLEVLGIDDISDKTRRGRYGTAETIYNGKELLYLLADHIIL